MSEKSEDPPESTEKMTAVGEASNLLKRLAEPRKSEDSVKAMITRVARLVSQHWPMTPTRAEDIWRQEARIIRAEEMDAIRKAADERIVGEAKRERTELEDRITRLEAALSLSDEEFHGPSLGALRQLVGRKARPMD